MRALNTHQVFIALLFSFVIIAARAGGAAQPLSDQVPADALVYVGWAGADALKPTYDQSHLAAVVNATNLPQLIDEHLPQFWQQVAGGGARPQQSATMKKLAELYWRYPVAFCIQPMKKPVARRSEPGVALLCDAGADAAALLQALRSMPPNAMGPGTRITQSGTVVTICSAAATTTGGLATDTSFIAALSNAQSSSALTLYANGTLMVDQVNQLAALDREGAVMWPKMRDALGVGGLKTLAITTGFEGKDWASTAKLAAPAPRSGLLTAIEPRAVEPALLARVPASANAVSATNFDAAKLVDVLRAAFVAGGNEKDFNMVLGAASVALGRNLRQQILAPLGSQWVIYSAPDSGGPVLINKVSDAKAAQDGLVSATYGIVGLLNAQFGRGNPPMVAISQSKSGETTITTATFQQFAPSMAIKDTVLYVGLSPASVTSALNAPDAGSNDVTKSAAFTAAWKQLGVAQPQSFSFANLPVTAPAAHTTLSSGLKTIHDLLASNGATLPEIKLPPLDQLTPHLSPSISAMWADDAGIAARSHSPFPLAAALLGDSQASIMSSGTLAAAADFVMPAMGRARENTNRVKCASNERRICRGILMYSSDHKGQYPPDLGSLISGGFLTADVFVCPTGSTKVPPAIRGAAKDEQAAWVNEHADYVYHGKGLLANKAMPETPVISEREGNHGPAGMNIGFADGHVELVNAARAKQLIGNAPNAGEQGL